MKRSLLVLFFCAVSCSAFAQMSGDYNYSIAARGFTLMQMPKILNESDSYKLTEAPYNGVMFKFNDNQISYRINGTYYNKSRSFYNNCETCEAADGKLVDYSLKVGFEKNFNYSRIQPYFGVDLGYRSNRFNGVMQNNNELRASASFSAIDGPVLDIEATKAGLVVAPFLGFKVNVVKQFSFFAEANLDYFYSYERQESVTQDANNTRTLNKTYKSEFLFNPVSVGLQIHLGSN
ncbi:MAG: hypothetical protein WKF66_00390 [Pedobacter sp.]